MKEKKSGKRAYLDSFHLDASGEYVYDGEHYRYSSESPRESTLKAFWLCAIGLCLSSVGSGLLPAAGPVSSFYVILPLVGEIIAAVLVLWAMIRLHAAGDIIRAYVYTATTEKLPVRAMICAIASGAGLVAEIIYLILNGFGGKVLATLVYMALKAISIALSLLLFSKVKKAKWEKL